MKFSYLTVLLLQVQGQGATDFLQGALLDLFRKSTNLVSRASRGSCLRIPPVNLGGGGQKHADHSKLI